MVNSRAFHLARVIVTRSGAAGVPGETRMVVVRVTPVHCAVIVTVVVTATGDVVTGNAPLAEPPLTTVSAGTLATAVLLENSCTTAPSVAPVNCNVPVAGLPPVRLLGVTETADKDGPAGVAAFTDRFAVRGTLSI